MSWSRQIVHFRPSYDAPENPNVTIIRKACAMIKKLETAHLYHDYDYMNAVLAFFDQYVTEDVLQGSQAREKILQFHHDLKQRLELANAASIHQAMGFMLVKHLNRRRRNRYAISQSKKPSQGLFALPNDVLFLLLNFLSLKDLQSVEQTSRYGATVVNSFASTATRKYAVTPHVIVPTPVKSRLLHVPSLQRGIEEDNEKPLLPFKKSGDTVGKVMTIVSLTLLLAAAGFCVAGPIGMAIGAGLGLIIGLIAVGGMILAERKREEEEKVPLLGKQPRRTIGFFGSAHPEKGNGVNGADPSSLRLGMTEGNSDR